LTEKKGIFDVNFKKDIFQNSIPVKKDGLLIETALEKVSYQLRSIGCRERTIYDYELITKYFIRDTKKIYLEDINTEIIYKWLETMTVKDTTKLTRLKCLKAFLNRCFDNGWFDEKFWRNINIKVNVDVKEGATDENVQAALSVLDCTRFLDLRNATAILLMYKCGLRVGTITKMTEHQIDFEERKLYLSGDVMKNHKSLVLPFDDTLAYLLETLIKHNKLIRKEYKQDNSLIFITMRGKTTQHTMTSNAIQKALRKLTLDYNLKNITPHALRRGFAKNIYEKSNNILLVSKALGHSDLSVTTRYLHTDTQQIAHELEKYL